MRHPPSPYKLLTLLVVIVLSACEQAFPESALAIATSTTTSQIDSTQAASPAPTLAPTPTASPLLPDWYQVLPDSYGVLKYQYALVREPEAKVYNSLQDALSDSSNFTHLPSVPGYVAYTGVEIQDGRTFYTLRFGKTMQSQNLQEVSSSTFSGILVEKDVEFRFGWVLSETQSEDMAGMPIRTYTRYQLVQESLTNTQRPGFIAVGLNEWLAEESLALVNPDLPTEAGRYSCRFIFVDLSEQTLSAYDNCRLVFATLVSSGQDVHRTRPGEFAVLYKMEYLTTSSDDGTISPYYLESVPYFMTYFGDFGFHGAYWHDQFGSPVSHGCINLSPADAAWLYAWAVLGERIFISDGR